MSIHIAAGKGDIAEVVLLPGDPLRAKFIAENLLEDAKQYTDIRNMLGFTGTYRGKRVSVQGTGMGIPSISIYVNELFSEYGVKRAIRIGTAGGLQPQIQIRDLILAMSACTNSGVNKIRFNGMSFAPTASFPLLKKAYDSAMARGWKIHVGSVCTSDLFYTHDPEEWKLWARWGCLAVEMETAELYTLAAKYGREALCILTISDNMLSHEVTSPQERQSSFTQMMEVALEAAIM